MIQQRTIFSPDFQDAFGIKAAAAVLERDKQEFVDAWQERNCVIESQYE